MIIVADIGNSNIHLGAYENAKVSNCAVFDHKNSEIDDLIKNVNLWVDSLGDVKHVSVACVYDPMIEYFDKLFPRISVFQIDSAMDVGLDISYEPKSSLGADRFANIVAFKRRYETTGIIVDIGSALTVDLVDKKGVFKGGIIFPGPALSSKALGSGTNRLPETIMARPVKKWGNSTEESIRCGIYSGYKVLVNGLIEDAKRELSDDVTVVVTGGWSDLWKQDWHQIDIHDNNLTLAGVGDIYHIITQKK